MPGTGDDAGKTVIYRDTWGVPHIYAPDVEAGLYAKIKGDSNPLFMVQRGTITP